MLYSTTLILAGLSCISSHAVSTDTHHDVPADFANATSTQGDEFGSATTYTAYSATPLVKTPAGYGPESSGTQTASTMNSFEWLESTATMTSTAADNLTPYSNYPAEYPVSSTDVKFETEFKSVATYTASDLQTTSTFSAPEPTETALPTPKQSEFTLLEEDRKSGRLVFIPYTAEQRNNILTNIETAIPAYFNKESKVPYKDYKIYLDQIFKYFRSNITDAEFQLGLSEAFTYLHDYQTLFTMSGPYSCFLATTGLKFQMVNEKTDSWKVEPTVVVSEVTTDPHRVSLHGSAYTQIQQGDILYSINGLNFTDWENSNWFNYSFFSKKSSSFQYASLEMLHAMGGGSTPLPTDDSIHFEFKSGSKNGTMYSVEVPYVNYRDDECWNMSSTLYKNLTGVTLAGTPAAESLHDTESLPFTYNTPYHGNLVFKKRGDSVRDKLYQLEMHGATLPTTNSTSNTTDSTAAHALNSTAAFTLHSTASEHIKWGIWSPLDKNLAVVRLDTFMPSVNHSTLTPVADTLEVLRYLLTHQLKYTRALVLDIRSNSGGLYDFASQIPQFFKPDHHPLQMQYLVNNATYSLFVNHTSVASPFYNAWLSTPPGSNYTTMIDIVPMQSVNLIGQMYLRPMGVFNNGGCYSACEMFTASIQDHNIGTVFGEDGQTSGSGSLSFDTQDLVSHNPVDFTPAPYTSNLTSPDGQTKAYSDFSVAVAQVVRGARFVGLPIEEMGVYTDVLVRPTHSDLQPNATTNTQLDRIADYLVQTGNSTKQNQLHFVAEPYLSEIIAGPFTLTCEVAGMDNVTLYNTDGLVLSSVTTNQTNIHNVSITADTKYTELGNNHVMLVGSSNGSQVLKTYREVRVVPTRANHHNLLSSNFTLGNVSTHVGVYNHPLTRSDQGWNKQGEAWVVNTNTTNTLGVDTTLESFFVSPVGSNVTVAIHANVDCTPAHDFVYIKVRHANGLIEPFFTSTFDPSTRSVGISGRNKTVDEAFTFTAITDSFSVMLQFVSNAGSLSNVIVHSMAVSTAIESSFRPRSV
ncbi:hypothetical protein RTP6_004129 [Batrachochytrium dendrobatidis]